MSVRERQVFAGCRRAGTAVGLVLLLLLAASNAQSDTQAQPESQGSDVDGSGSTVASSLVLKMIEVIKSWTTPAAGFTYRSVGSSTGQADTKPSEGAPENDFSIGDFPLSTQDWQAAQDSGNAAVQIPLMISALSFYHSIPGIAGQGALTLNCAVLARIFSNSSSGEVAPVVRWNDQSIKNLNPDLANDLPDTEIVLVLRELGSGSTYGITSYFHSNCPDSWPLGAGSAIVNAWNTTLPNALRVRGSHNMAEMLSITPNALGYLDAGHAGVIGLKEVAITNQVTRLTSSQANLTSAYMQQFFNDTYPDKTPLDDWSGFDLINLPGNQTWPLCVVSFYYTRLNVSWLEEEGSLLQLFVRAVLSDDGTDFMKQLGYIPLPAALRTSMGSWFMSNLIVSSGQRYHYEDDINVTSGSNDWVISTNRQNYVYQTVFDMEDKVQQLRDNARLGHAYQVHGSGSSAPAAALRLIMLQLTEQAREPIRATYRAVGGAQAEFEFLDFNTNIRQYNHFKVGDAPLSAANHQQLQVPGSPGVLQLPFAAAALGIYYNLLVPGAPSMNLDACTLTDIMSGKIDKWRDLFPNNVNSDLLNQRIWVYTYEEGHTMMRTLEAYLRKACPAYTGKVTGCSKCSSTLGPVGSISSPDIMVQALTSTDSSAYIGFLPSSFAEGTTLFAAHLKVSNSGTYLTPSAAGAANALAAFDTSALPQDWSADWSAINALDVQGADPPAWPITQIMYFWVYRNLTQYQYSGPLTKALLSYTLSTDGQSLISTQGLAPLPGTWQLLARQQLTQLACDPLLEDWRTEVAGQVGNRGQGLFTFSTNRQAALNLEVQQLQALVSDLVSQQAMALPANVRLVVSGDAALVVRQGLTLAERAATQPLKTTLEYVPKQATAVSRLGPLDVSTHLAILDTPLTAAQHMTLSSYYQQMIQVPLFIRSVSVLVNSGQSQPTLTLTPCKVAYILSGVVNSWQDSRLTDGWDAAITQLLPTTGFVVLTASKTGGDYLAMKQYAGTCSSVQVTSDAFTQEVSSGKGEDVVNNVASMGAFAAIGIISRFLVDVSGLAGTVNFTEFALQSRQGPYLNSSLPADLATTTSAAASYTILIDTALGGGVSGVSAVQSQSSLVKDFWPAWNLGLVWANMPTATYPVIRADFLVLPADLSAFNTTSGAIAGLAAFLTSPTFQNQSSPSTDFLYPGLSALGPLASQYASGQLTATAFRLAPGAQAWPVTSSISPPSLMSANATAGAIMTSAWTADSVASSSAVTPSYVQQAALRAANDALLAARQAVVAAQDKANLAYAVAIAAIVIGTILSLAALGLVLYVHRQLVGVQQAQRVMQSAGSSTAPHSELINGPSHVYSGPVPDGLLAQHSVRK